MHVVESTSDSTISTCTNVNTNIPQQQIYILPVQYVSTTPATPAVATTTSMMTAATPTISSTPMPTQISSFTPQRSLFNRSNDTILQPYRKTKSIQEFSQKDFKFGRYPFDWYIVDRNDAIVDDFTQTHLTTPRLISNSHLNPNSIIK